MSTQPKPSNGPPLTTMLFGALFIGVAGLFLEGIHYYMQESIGGYSPILTIALYFGVTAVATRVCHVPKPAALLGLSFCLLELAKPFAVPDLFMFTLVMFKAFATLYYVRCDWFAVMARKAKGE